MGPGAAPGGPGGAPGGPGGGDPQAMLQAIGEGLMHALQALEGLMQAMGMGDQGAGPGGGPMGAPPGGGGPPPM